ncbi:Gfo/Idh/MocA family protein [Arthrobacter glacialis]|uniref:Oxidoreductase n=1 Tax=Arthrobacter glacialis TaxID=1664 RepID=A0A2S3ZS67_ARTGL|nr:Gfo/Idh/MocA family oxidoreductase [Arthrobacter glacialis]POH72081.1 oxidoreductase [Arthrobacter glacialis]
MTQRIRTALLGFGHAGSIFHAPAIASLPDFALDVIVTSNPQRQAQARAAYPQARVIDRAVWAASQLDVDLVVVGTPPATHGGLTRDALEAGCAVVVDKPFTVTSAEGEELIALARERGLLLTTYQNRRWDAEILTVKKLMEQGRLGHVRRFESRLERWQPVITKEWKAKATVASGGGILFDLGTHLIDQALQLFGPATRVYGELAARRPQELADDDAFVALEHVGGVISHLWMNLNAPQLGPRLRVVGSEASYTKQTADIQESQLMAGLAPGDPRYGVDPQENWGLLGRDGTLELVPTERASFGRFYELLAEAILRGGPVPVNPADSVAALRIIEKIRAQVG